MLCESGRAYRKARQVFNQEARKSTGKESNLLHFPKEKQVIKSIRASLEKQGCLTASPACVTTGAYRNLTPIRDTRVPPEHLLHVSGIKDTSVQTNHKQALHKLTDWFCNQVLHCGIDLQDVLIEVLQDTRIDAPGKSHGDANMYYARVALPSPAHVKTLQCQVKNTVQASGLKWFLRCGVRQSEAKELLSNLRTELIPTLFIPLYCSQEELLRHLSIDEATSLEVEFDVFFDGFHSDTFLRARLQSKLKVFQGRRISTWLPWMDRTSSEGCITTRAERIRHSLDELFRKPVLVTIQGCKVLIHVRPGSWICDNKAIAILMSTFGSGSPYREPWRPWSLVTLADRFFLPGASTVYSAGNPELCIEILHQRRSHQEGLPTIPWRSSGT
jgi:hypothetical protein